jgi:hypothetical protein
METRTRCATGEALLIPPCKRRSTGGRLPGDPGKSTEEERVTEGAVGGVKRGNARGTQGPSCV